MPTPRPIFWFRESPLPSADGASGSAATLGRPVELDVVDLVEEKADAEEEDVEDMEALVEDMLMVLIDVENVAAEDAVKERIVLLGPEDNAERVGLEDCDRGTEDTDCIGVVSSPVVCGVAVGHAVSGPNLTIK